MRVAAASADCAGMDSIPRPIDRDGAGVDPALARSDLGRIARLLDLDAAETRLLERLLAGDGLPRAARLLGIPRLAASALLDRLLAKAGAADRAQLDMIIEGAGATAES